MAATDPGELYLELLKRCLTNVIYRDPPVPARPGEPSVFDLEARLAGRDSPSRAHTMIGRRRLDNIQQAIELILRDDVPGDLIEAGVARGGAAIFMRAVLRAHGVNDRTVWLADSFGEFPRSGAAGMTARSYTSPYWGEMAALASSHPEHMRQIVDNAAFGTSAAAVRDHVERYGLADDRVRLLAGWFSDTLVAPPMRQLAMLRVDADLYDSTIQVLRRLYPLLAPGGFVIIDDYHTFSECREAVGDFMSTLDVLPRMADVDDACVWWRKHSDAMASTTSGG